MPPPPPGNPRIIFNTSGATFSTWEPSRLWHHLVSNGWHVQNYDHYPRQVQGTFSGTFTATLVLAIPFSFPPLMFFALSG